MRECIILDLQQTSAGNLLSIIRMKYNDTSICLKNQNKHCAKLKVGLLNESLITFDCLYQVIAVFCWVTNCIKNMANFSKCNL